MSSQATLDASRRRELIRIRRSLNRIQDEALLLRRDMMAARLGRKFNPDQPRIPAGGTGGGRWTSGEGGGGGGSHAASAGLGEGAGFGDGLGEGLVDDTTGEASWFPMGLPTVFAERFVSMLTNFATTAPFASTI